jgi:hypothetical protein
VLPGLVFGRTFTARKPMLSANMSMMQQFQKLDDLIKEHTEQPIQNMLRGQLALTREQIEAFQEKSDTQDATLAKQLHRITELQDENARLKDELHRLKNQHAEEVYLWQGIEYRRGKRTFQHWVGCCPKCHLPISFEPYGYPISCSGGCGWKTNERSDEVKKFLSYLEEQTTKSGKKKNDKP